MQADIEQRAKEQDNGRGYSKRTLANAKAKVGVVSIRVGTKWAWRDPSVIEREAPESKDEKILHKLDEIERLAQAPKASTTAAISDGTKPTLEYVETRDADLNALDESGFHTAPPKALGLAVSGNVNPMQIMVKARELDETPGTDPRQNFITVFEWAYPAAGLSESIVASMLRRELVAGVQRSDIPSLQAVAAVAAF